MANKLSYLQVDLKNNLFPYVVIVLNRFEIIVLTRFPIWEWIHWWRDTLLWWRTNTLTRLTWYSLTQELLLPTRRKPTEVPFTTWCKCIFYKLLLWDILKMNICVPCSAWNSKYIIITGLLRNSSERSISLSSYVHCTHCKITTVTQCILQGSRRSTVDVLARNLRRAWWRVWKLQKGKPL